MAGSWSQLEATAPTRSRGALGPFLLPGTGQGLLLRPHERSPGCGACCAALGSVLGWRQPGETQGELSCSLLSLQLSLG